jgi:hypothetical protein
LGKKEGVFSIVGEERLGPCEREPGGGTGGPGAPSFTESALADIASRDGSFSQLMPLEVLLALSISIYGVFRCGRSSHLVRDDLHAAAKRILKPKLLIKKLLI